MCILYFLLKRFDMPLKKSKHVKSEINKLRVATLILRSWYSAGCFTVTL